MSSISFVNKGPVDMCELTDDVRVVSHIVMILIVIVNQPACVYRVLAIIITTGITENHEGNNDHVAQEF